MESENIKNEDKSFLLSNQVKRELQNRGYSSIFNYTDYKHFKTKCRNSFNKAVSIALMFIEEADPRKNDYSNFIF